MKNIYEIYIVKENNFIRYNITNKINTSPISVSVNNEIKIESVDYTIVGEALIFTNPLSIGDKIIINNSISDDVKLVTKNSYSQNALFKIFSSDTKFKSNHKYKYSLTISNEEHINEFTTKYDPFYISIEKIRTDTGDLLNSVTDAQIAKVIYLNSKDALEKIEENDIDITEKFPTYIRNYVRYKTDIDFCYAIYLSISGKYGSYSKKIGDIQIDNTYKLPYLQDMIGRFKDLLKPNEELLNSGVSNSGSVLSFVKAQKTTYPVSNRGVF